MIVQTPNPVLVSVTKKIQKVDKKILEIIGRMKKILVETDNPKGVGLAAPQIGLSLAIFITRPTEKTPIRVFLNPKITWASGELGELIREEQHGKSVKNEKKLEGCLSIKNIWGHLLRPKKVRLKYMDTDSVWHEEEFSGFMATIVQHETDHLNGILFTQRVMEQKEKLFEIETDSEGNEKLVEIKI